MAKSRQRRPTEIGWDTEDDEDLVGHGSSLDKRRRSVSDDYDWVDRRPHRPEPCNLCSSFCNSNNDNDAKDMFKNLDLSEDAAPQKMVDRKWALAHGKFKVLTQVQFLPLEESHKFKVAVNIGRPIGKIRYVRVPRGYTEDELKRNSRSCIAIRKTQYSYIKAEFPGSGERHHIVWTTMSGDIHIDRMVKLYDICSIQCHQVEVDCRGPKSPWFGLVDPKLTQTVDGRIHFDANMFWTAGLLYKHFDTTGIESWDAQLDEMRTQFTRPPPPIPLSTTLPPSYPMLLNYPQKPQQFVPIPAVRDFIPLPIPPSERVLTSTPINAGTVPPLLPSSAALPAVPMPPPSCCHNCKSGLVAMNSVNKDIPPPVINGRYTGCIIEWKKNFGFVKSDHIPGLVFLHRNDIINWDDQLLMPPGLSVKFSLRFDHIRGYVAFNAKLFL